MIVLVAVVAAFVVFRDVNRNDPPSPVRAIDYAQDAAFARREAGFDVLAPASLPAGWIATTARYVDGRAEAWHLGLLTDEQRYVGLEQSTAPAASMVAEHVDPNAVEDEPVTVGGEQWSAWSDDGGDLALVREDGGSTILVVGHDVSSAELAAFVSSLR